MIKHIVMWKLDSAYPEEEKKGILQEMKEKLSSLEGKIDTLKSINVFLNAKNAAPDNYDILLDTTFETLEGLSVYANHPEHLKVVDFMSGIKKVRACADYEV